MQTVGYVRLYADADGETHFSQEQLGLKSINFAPPAPPLNVSDFIPVKQFGLIHCPAGWVGAWHPTPRRQFIIYLSGEMDFEVSDGEVRRLKPGNVLLLEDTSGKGHASRVIGGDCTMAGVQLPES
jgi:redox-sensitive bicupin YhaK (pirin superfamily)